MRLSDHQQRMLQLVRDRGVVNLTAITPTDYSAIVRTRNALVRRGLIEQHAGLWRLTLAGRVALGLEGGG